VATTTASEAIDVAHKIKQPSSSLGKSVEKSPGFMPFCRSTSKPPISLNGDGITSAASSSNESNDGATGSTISLTKLVHQNPHLPIDEVKDQVTNESPSTKLTLPPSKNVELFQPNLTTNAKAGANQIRYSNASEKLVRPLQQIASNFGTQEPISTFRLSYVSGIWRTLCECITQFSVDSSKSLNELEKGVALILKGLLIGQK
ncbi:hypothetical protein HAX54_043822, partial [Datura stramonium]|nr:hypothetical protein [Datura stramonium]